MTLIDLNDPKNAASRGDVPGAVRWLVEVPFGEGDGRPDYLLHKGGPRSGQWCWNGFGAGRSWDDAAFDCRRARPATAAEIAANCPDKPDSSSCLRETLEAVLAYLDKRTGVFIPDKNDFFAACAIRGTVIATLKENSRANAH